MNTLSFISKDLLRRRSEFTISLVGIAFSIAAVFILFSLKLGIEQTLWQSAERKNPLSEITVFGESGGLFLKILGATEQKKLTPEVAGEIRKMPHVTAVFPHLVFNDLASIEVEILGQTLRSDSLIFGLPREIVEQDIPSEIAWSGTDKPIPVVISRKLIDLYNLSLAPGAGLPQISEETFKGKNIKIFPGYSSFLGGETKEILEGRIVGFSDRVDLTGITVPMEVIKGKVEVYNKLFVTVDSPKNVERVTKLVEEKGFRTTSLQKEFKEVGRSLKYIEIILFVLSATLLITSILLVASNFWSSLLARKAELGILRAIGATKNILALVFILEASVLGSLGGAIGIGLGTIATKLFQRLLQQSISLSSISVESFFAISPILIINLLLLSILLSIISSSIPIIRMISRPPRELFVLK